MINWKYIKGLYQDTNGNGIYTFLTFSDGQAASSVTTNAHKLPSIYYSSDGLFPSSGNNLGRIITQLATGQSIDVDFKFTEKVTIDKTIDHKGDYAWYGLQNHYLIPSSNDNDFSFDIGSKSLTESSVASDYTGAFAGFWSVKNGVYIMRFYNDDLKVDVPNGYLNIGQATAHSNAGDLSAKAIYANGICEALYFNATSDKRAKKDFKELSINALDLIKKVQLYSFKYKDSDTPSIGIIAQDIKDIEIEGFKLVDNENASGLDMDYMSIHESKLIYILWKAIQEQQQEIEELKKRLK